MVLKNSKWDRKAKFQYMKKHGISVKPKKAEVEGEVAKKKWSSKRGDGTDNRVVLSDSEDEYDSEVDDALIEHFYPSLGEAELSREQKIKVKQQIIRDLEEQEEEPEESDVEVDGIYLGSDENKAKEMDKSVDQPSKFNLEEFMANAEQHRTRKTRKLLNHKMTDNFLEEYGLSSYDELAKHKKDDYNDLYYAKRGQRNLHDVSSKELDGFVIGEQSIATTKGDIRSNSQPKNNIQYLSNEEIQQDKDRAEKVEKERLYKEIKQKLDKSKPNLTRPKVLEINTLNNAEQLSSLNTNLIANAAKQKNSISDADLDNDIDFLLGTSTDANGSKSGSGTSHTTTKPNHDIDMLLSDLSMQDNSNSKDKSSAIPKQQARPKPQNLDFLDELLG